MADLIPIPPPPGDPGLTASILARTSGSPCGRLRSLACDFADGALEPDRAALVQAHLDICAGCAALVSALRFSSAALPALAEADAGPWFAERVMRATAWAPRPASGLRGGWARLMRRPRIALEAAYLGAMAGFVGFSLPAPSFLRAWRAPAVVQPLSASAGNLVQAERRTAAAMSGLFVAPEGQPPRLFQRFLERGRAWFAPGEPADAAPRPSHQTRD